MKGRKHHAKGGPVWYSAKDSDVAHEAESVAPSHETNDESPAESHAKAAFKPYKRGGKAHHAKGGKAMHHKHGGKVHHAEGGREAEHHRQGHHVGEQQHAHRDRQAEQSALRQEQDAAAVEAVSKIKVGYEQLEVYVDDRNLEAAKKAGRVGGRRRKNDDKIKKAIELRKKFPTMKASEIAEKTGISESYVSYLLRGKRRISA